MKNKTKNYNKNIRKEHHPKQKDKYREAIEKHFAIFSNKYFSSCFSTFSYWIIHYYSIKKEYCSICSMIVCTNEWCFSYLNQQLNSFENFIQNYFSVSVNFFFLFLFRFLSTLVNGIQCAKWNFKYSIQLHTGHFSLFV